MVCALSDEESLHLGDTVTNPAFREYYEYLTEEYIDLVYGFKDPGITDWPIDPTKPIGPGGDSVQKTIYSDPLITGFLDSFGQGYPYNLFCPLDEYGQRSLVGCGPLAVGTVMGYFEWPDSYSGVSFDWSSMKLNSYNSQWARLFEICGRPENLNASYGTMATATNPSNMIRTFSNMGYSNSKYEDFVPGNVSASLKKESPVVVCGWKDSGVGHAWVIDGGYKIYEKKDNLETYYYHNIWGWNGSGNGYFMYSMGTLGGNPVKYDNSDHKDIGNFGGMKIVYGYTPNR